MHIYTAAVAAKQGEVRTEKYFSRRITPLQQLLSNFPNIKLVGNILSRAAPVWKQIHLQSAECFLHSVFLHLSLEFPPRNHQQLYVEKGTKRGKIIHLFTAACKTDQNALQSSAFIFAACQESVRLCVVLTATTHYAKPSKCIQQSARLVFERHSGKCSRLRYWYSVSSQWILQFIMSLTCSSSDQVL